MPATLYGHMTWTTRERAPLITQAIAQFLEHFLPLQAERYGAKVLALGIVQDHVHALLHLRPDCDIADLARGLKGASSRLVNRDGIASPQRPLRWARGYDLRSVAPRGLVAVERYIRDQAQRHPLDAVSVEG